MSCNQWCFIIFILSTTIHIAVTVNITIPHTHIHFVMYRHSDADFLPYSNLTGVVAPVFTTHNRGFSTAFCHCFTCMGKWCYCNGNLRLSCTVCTGEHTLLLLSLFLYYTLLSVTGYVPWKVPKIYHYFL